MTSFKEIPVGDCVIERFQVRKANLGKNIEELAISIKRWGLFHPIVVCECENDPNTWEIICGQRRHLAYTQYEIAETIEAKVVPRPTLEDGIAMSLSENEFRDPMSNKDLIDACSRLYMRYLNMKMVSQELGLPYALVRKCIKFDGLPADLQEMVKEKEVNLKLAMTIQDAASTAGKYDPVRSKELVRTD